MASSGARGSASVYVKTVNQSLLATVLHVTYAGAEGGNPVLNPIFLVTSLVLILITFWPAVRLPQRHSDWTYVSVLLLGLRDAREDRAGGEPPAIAQMKAREQERGEQRCECRSTRP
jgi:hypothetical protein